MKTTMRERKISLILSAIFTVLIIAIAILSDFQV